MQLNPPSKVRKAIYVVIGIVNIVVGYLALKGLVGEAETASWALLNTFILGLAGVNVSPDDQEKSL